MMWALVALALMAQPVAAECFVGLPSKVTYSSGAVMTILDKKRDKVTNQWTRPDGDVSVVTTQLGLFRLEVRVDGRTRRTKWEGPLPRLADLVPGYQFDLSGISEAVNGLKETVQVTGSVAPGATIQVGNCAYETTVVHENFTLNGEWLYHTKNYLRTDMLVVLRSETYFSGGDTATPNVAISLE
jgi:hypothetical protein